MPRPPASPWIKKLAGRFVVFDGPDGSGKSTQFAKLAALCLESGLDVVEVREPGGTPIGEQIRTVLLDPRNERMDLRCEMLLYMASRAQLVIERIRPALDAGSLVLADRFISSTLAYQGSAGGLSRDSILQVGVVAVGDTWPDLTIIFDVDEATAAQRLVGGGSKGRRGRSASQLGLFADRMEQQDLEYRRRVRRGYLDQAGAAPDKYVVLDAAADAETVFARLLSALEAWTCS